MSVRRYSPTYQCPEDWSDDSAMVACDDGLYVLATDYDALQAEVERLKAELAGLRNTCKHKAFYDMARGFTCEVIANCRDCGALMTFTPVAERTVVVHTLDGVVVGGPAPLGGPFRGHFQPDTTGEKHGS
jgi:hypothetical protein